VTLWEAHAGAGFWRDLWTHGEDPTLERFADRVCDPVGHPRWSSLFLKDCIPWEGLTLEQGKSVRSLPPEEEGVAETMCAELTATPIHLPHLGGGGRKLGVKLSPGRRGGVGGRSF